MKGYMVSLIDDFFIDVGFKVVGYISYVCMCVCLCLCVCMCVYVCVCVCVFVFVLCRRGGM